MSRKNHHRTAARRPAQAPIFAALGDQTRLSLVTKLSDGQARSITQLADGYKLTRQAITKHLRVLEKAGLVRSIHSGRESLFDFDPKPVKEIKDYLNFVSEQWEQSLQQLKLFVEE